MVAKYDQDFIDTVTRRLASLPADRKPQWGSLTAAGVLGHLTESLQYSMGLLGDKPTKTSFLSRNIIKPLIINGIISFPKGVKGVPLPFEPGDLETLRQAMNDYLEALEKRTDTLNPHPLFGPLTLGEWTNFHVLHFKHHLKQFDV